jgi:hypothetical protein
MAKSTSRWIVMRFALVLSLAGAAACGGSEESDPGAIRSDTEGQAAHSGEARQANGAPQVEERYQERVDEAWQEAFGGENPSATCAGLKGRAATSPEWSATRALEACNIDIPARYFLNYVDRVEAGEQTCIHLMTEVTTKLPAMYLEGRWCFHHELRDGEAGIIDFDADGTNRTGIYQVWTQNEYRWDATETLAGFRRMYPEIVDIEPDRFVGSGPGGGRRVVFERAPC